MYPDGIEKNWNDGRTGEESGARAHREQIDDVGFIAALIDRFVAKENVDAGRVYATGMSNGAIMCYRLACELSIMTPAVFQSHNGLPRSLPSMGAFRNTSSPPVLLKNRFQSSPSIT